MPTIAEVRAKFPQYEDMSDGELADALHRKYYSDMPPEEFARRIGLPAGGQRFDDAFAPAPEASPEVREAARVAGGGKPAPSTFGAAMQGIGQGITFGFGDELMAGLKTGAGLWGDYGAEVENQREGLRRAQEAHPVAYGVGEVGGAVPTLLIPGAGAVGQVARGASVGARMVGGAKAGALYGALAGAGHAEGDLGDRLQGAAYGGTLGGATGGVIPAGTAAVGAVARPVANAVAARVNPEGYAARQVAGRLQNAGRDADQVATRMERAAGTGQTMSVADLGGDSARDLLRSAANVPGRARNNITAQVNRSQMAQGARLRTQIDRLLGDPDGYAAVKSEIMAARGAAAEPYYRQAYARNVPFTRELEQLLNTPAGRAGLVAAKRNAENRREPWAHWFANVADDGTIIDLRRVPDTRALDEVQRVLRQMRQDAMAAPDGSPFARARRTPDSDAIGSVHDDLLRIMDEHNPAFRRAREVAMDNIQADEALEFGRNALNTDARTVAARMTNAGRGSTAIRGTQPFTEGQREMARVGLVEALRGKIDEAGMTHNALLKFFNSSEQRARLRPFFRSQEDWNTFRTAMFNEARKRKTYGAVTGNSTTARQLADMEAANSAADTVGTVAQAATGGIIPATLATVQRGLRRLGGFTPEVADRIGKMLMTTDPAKARAIVDQIRQIEQRAGSREDRQNQIRKALLQYLGGQEGRLLAPQPSEP